MELGLLRSLMDKQFYDDHRGAKCPTKIFSKDAQKIKVIIDPVSYTHLTLPTSDLV